VGALADGGPTFIRGAKIGDYFHPIMRRTVIGETVEIRARTVKITRGVSPDAPVTGRGQALREPKRHPTIEDGVTIYAGTRFMGGER